MKKGIASLAVVIAFLASSCSAPQPARGQGAQTGTAIPTPAAVGRPTRSPTATPLPTATATVLPAPTITPTLSISPTLAATPSPAPTAALSGSATAQPGPAAASEPAFSIPISAPSLDPNKYPAPVLLAPDNNSVYHVAQPIVHFTWTNTPSALLTFGELPQCTSDTTHFRHIYETNQLVIHSLSGAQPDLVEQVNAGTSFDLNLTTVPAGQYSWSVNIGVVCTGYVIGQRDTTISDTYLGQVSPSSASRTFNWIP
jgi:hypothetical protein